MLKKMKDKNAPKRPLSSFILFGNSLRDSDEKIRALPIQEQASTIGRMWKEADDKTKEPFNTRAAELKQEYDAKRAEYEKTEEYREFQQMSKDNSKANKKQRSAGPSKMTGYRLFVSENKEATSEDEKDPELAGKGHMARCGLKWKKLTEAQKNAYTVKAAEMNGAAGLNGDDSE
ncbi:hypothetical protein PAPHI01_0861 [Pancytospora philotis]|nr:hypothetical protein PAPHI01_0861 [Pancytospora philotis]